MVKIAHDVARMDVFRERFVAVIYLPLLIHLVSQASGADRETVIKHSLFILLCRVLIKLSFLVTYISFRALLAIATPDTAMRDGPHYWSKTNCS
jgi:hypothetical protein